MSGKISITKLVLVPAVATLAVTLLRVTGELLHWSRTLFNPTPGGGGAIVGIVWLIPVFGVYFALRLAKLGEAPERPGRAIGYAALGFAILAAGFLMFQYAFQSLHGLVVMWGTAALGGMLPRYGWRGLYKVLIAYAYLARIPVAIVMLLATLGAWESHYSALAFPTTRMSPLAQYFLLGFFPQLVWWVGLTLTVGVLVGSVAAAIALQVKSRKPMAA
ncbi:MAG: hypothetical protein LAO07_10075 [Acidobacteriia bacterium]|nr:hypothetical protein [Terriglobia bacterium]